MLPVLYILLQVLYRYIKDKTTHHGYVLLLLCTIINWSMVICQGSTRSELP